MDITTSSTIAFAYTIKALGASDIAASHYDPFFNRLSKLSIQLEYKVSEKDKLGKIHFHGIMYLPKGFYRKRLCMNGFHMKLREITDKSGWIRYIHKDCEFHHLEAMAEERENQIHLTKSIFKRYKL